MRTIKTEPKIGQIRFVKRFLFLPLSIRVEKKVKKVTTATVETRWLETVTIKETLVRLADGDGWPIESWEPIGFEDTPLAYDER